MTTYVCRWPNGVLSIVSGETQEDALRQLSADGICTLEQAERGDGVIMELPADFRLHLFLQPDGGFEFRGWPADSVPTVERLYPKLGGVLKATFQTKKARRAAIPAAIRAECGLDPK